MKASKNYRSSSEFYNLRKDNNDDKTCCLKFSSCDDNKYPLWRLKQEQLKMFISYAKKVEKLQWQEIYHYKGLNFEKIDNVNIPDYLDSSISIYSMRVDKKFRILGYRNDSDFYIVRFDNNHETC